MIEIQKALNTFDVHNLISFSVSLTQHIFSCSITPHPDSLRIPWINNIKCIKKVIFQWTIKNIYVWNIIKCLFIEKFSNQWIVVDNLGDLKFSNGHPEQNLEAYGFWGQIQVWVPVFCHSWSNVGCVTLTKNKCSSSKKMMRHIRNLAHIYFTSIK